MQWTDGAVCDTRTTLVEIQSGTVQNNFAASIYCDQLQDRLAALGAEAHPPTLKLEPHRLVHDLTLERDNFLPHDELPYLFSVHASARTDVTCC